MLWKLSCTAKTRFAGVSMTGRKLGMLCGSEARLQTIHAAEERCPVTGSLTRELLYDGKYPAALAKAYFTRRGYSDESVALDLLDHLEWMRSRAGIAFLVGLSLLLTTLFLTPKLEELSLVRSRALVVPEVLGAISMFLFAAGWFGDPCRHLAGFERYLARVDERMNSVVPTPPRPIHLTTDQELLNYVHTLIVRDTHDVLLNEKVSGKGSAGAERCRTLLRTDFDLFKTGGLIPEVEYSPFFSEAEKAFSDPQETSASA